MKLASIAGRVHIDHPKGWIDVAQAAPGAASTLVELLAQDRALLAEAARGEPNVGVEASFDAPLQPGQLIDGFAFEGHVKNARARRGQEVPPEWYDTPVWYRSNPRGLVPPGGTVLFPFGETECDFECELACVIGVRVKSPSVAEAEAAIFGYTLFNDWSARMTQKHAMKVGLGPNPGKDFAASLGPVVVTADAFGDPAAAVLSARVDGETWCEARVGEARWSCAELVAAVADGTELWPGDVVAMGTVPNGCGLEQGRFLHDGARVELHEARIGTLLGIAGRAAKRDKPWVRT